MILSKDGDLVFSRRKKLIDVYYRKILQLLDRKRPGGHSFPRTERKCSSNILEAKHTVVSLNLKRLKPHPFLPPFCCLDEASDGSDEKPGARGPSTSNLMLGS